MKKFLATFCALFLLSTTSYATGFFVGADALFANARHKAKTPSSSDSAPKNGAVQDADKMNYGFNAGVRLDVLNLLVSGEVFYDNLQTSSRNFQLSDGTISGSDSIKLKDRYGVKANVGFAILPRVTPFLTYGLASVNYESNVLSNNNSTSKSEMAPLCGVGILVDLPFGISAKASYDYQKVNMRYAEVGSKINTHLGVAKLGVVYNF